MTELSPQLATNNTTLQKLELGMTKTAGLNLAPSVKDNYAPSNLTQSVKVRSPRIQNRDIKSDLRAEMREPHARTQPGNGD
jgi:hypothetical protein